MARKMPRRISRQEAARLLLLALKEHVRTWEGVLRILATYKADPAGQGQRAIRAIPAYAWECQCCAHTSEPDRDPPRPAGCPECGGEAANLRLITATLHVLVGASRQPQNPFVDHYRVVTFVHTLYRWAELATGEKRMGLLLDYWGIGATERECSMLMGVSSSWVHRRRRNLIDRFMARME